MADSDDKSGRVCRLALEDGCVFTGAAFGAGGTRTGEVVFNTSLTGYQEVFTDPSYCGQIVTMTFPLIGNYGVNPEDFESHKAFLSGFVVKELPPRFSNHRAKGSLAEFLREQDVIGLAGVDTRAVTRRIRMQGAVRGVISTEIADDLELVKMAQAAPSMAGANLVSQVASAAVANWSEGLSALSDRPEPRHSCRAEGTTAESAATCHLVAIDCGIKHNILRHLAQCGARVTVAPAGASAGQIRDLAPDGLLVGNGPGDPAAVTDTINTLRELIGTIPILGICLGHQMLALALGAETYKLKFGHHGGNLPVMNLPAQRVEITSQNHGFAVDAASLERIGAQVTHVNLNDKSNEGFLHADKQLLTVQFHPEASPGPHDAAYLFRHFVESVKSGRPVDAGLLVD